MQTEQTPTPLKLETFEQLEGFLEIKANQIEVGDHIRYTVDKYNVPDTRKCVYAVILKRSKDKTAFKVSGYKSDPCESWVLDLSNRFKTYRFYKKVVEERQIAWN